LNRTEGANLISRFLDGSSEPYEWDDFTSVRCKDSVLESARQRCAAVQDEYPSENPGEYCNSQGVEVLRRIAAELRERAV
jgi:hypothetical protein